MEGDRKKVGKTLPSLHILKKKKKKKKNRKELGLGLLSKGRKIVTGINPELKETARLPMYFRK